MLVLLLSLLLVGCNSTELDMTALDAELHSAKLELEKHQAELQKTQAARKELAEQLEKEQERYEARMSAIMDLPQLTEKMHNLEREVNRLRKEQDLVR